MILKLCNIRHHIKSCFIFFLFCILGFSFHLHPATCDFVQDNVFIQGDLDFLEDNSLLIGRLVVSGTLSLVDRGTVSFAVVGGHINNIDMNNGTMELIEDLEVFDRIILDFNISGSISTCGSDVKTIFLDKNQSWSGELYFLDDVILDCRGQKISLNNLAQFNVAAGKTVTLRNMLLSDLKDDWLIMAGDDSTVKFENVFFQSNPYSSDISENSCLEFRDDCVFAKGLKLTNTVTIGFQSSISTNLDLNYNELKMVTDLVLFGDFLPNEGTLSSSSTVTRTLYIQKDQAFATTLNIKDNIILDGKHYIWDLQNEGKFFLEEGAFLTLKDINFVNLSDDWVNDISRVEIISDNGSGGVVITGGDEEVVDSLLEFGLKPKTKNVYNGKNGELHVKSSGRFVVKNKSTLLFKDVEVVQAHSDWLSVESGSKVMFKYSIFDVDPYVNLTDDKGELVFNGLSNQFNGGLTLPQDISLGSKYPFSGVLNLNGKHLRLTSDLIFDANGFLDASLSGTISADIDGARTIYFNSNQTINRCIDIDSSITINGGGKQVDLGDSGCFNVKAGKSLTLKNIYIKRDPINNWFLGEGDYIWGQGVVVTT